MSLMNGAGAVSGCTCMFAVAYIVQGHWTGAWWGHLTHLPDAGEEVSETLQ